MRTTSSIDGARRVEMLLIGVLTLVFWSSIFAACTPKIPTVHPAPESISEEQNSEASDSSLALPQKRNLILGQQVEVASSIWRDSRHLTVYVPPKYDADPNKRYPVIYLIDGGIDQDFLAICGVVSNLSMWGQSPNFIIVGIETKQRYHELSSPSQVEADLERAPNPGGAASMRRYIVEEVIPWVDSSYATDERRVLMGESMAGLFVLETMLELGDTFAAYLAVSPSLWWNDQALSRGAEKALLGSLNANFRVYFSLADEGGAMREGINRVDQTLQKIEYPAHRWHYESRHRESHATTYLPAAAEGLRWISQSWKAQPEKNE